MIDEASVVTDAERAAAGRWLVTHRVDMPTMTDLLALRLGIRGGARPRGSWRWIVAGVLAAMAANIGFTCLQYLPGVRGVELTDGAFMVFFTIAVQLFVRAPVRLRDRRALALPGVRAFDRPPGTGLGAWDVATLLITFGGGAALGVTIFLTTPFRTYAWSWLLLLALGGVVTAVILTGILRRPVIAEDETSLAVDGAVRIFDLATVMPAVYAVPVVLDPLTDNAQPPEYTRWLLGYAALAVATQVVTGLVNRRRSRGILATVIEAPAPLLGT